MMRGISAKTKELIEYAYGLLKVDHPQTLRQLHYAIFGCPDIEYDNDQASYKRLSRATTFARRAYREWELRPEPRGVQPRYAIPPGWMVDVTRVAEIVNVWEDQDAYIETVKNSYRRDNWQTQSNYVEIWSEKDTILSAIRPVAEKWGVPLRSCHGFGSTGMESQIGERFEAVGKPVTVYYLGDHDPSGHVIERDIHSRAEKASGITFHMERLAIHASISPCSIYRRKRSRRPIAEPPRFELVLVPRQIRLNSMLCRLPSFVGASSRQ